MKIHQRGHSVNPRRRTAQKGAAMIEGALVLVTLLSTILFTMDISRMLLYQQFYTERTRTTARNAVVNNWTDDSTKNYLCYNTTTAPAAINGVVTPGLLGCLPSTVTVSTLGTSGSSDYRLQVKVSGIQVLTWIPYMAGRYTLGPMIAIMPIESQGATN